MFLHVLGIIVLLAAAGCTYQIDRSTGLYTLDGCEEMRRDRSVANMVTGGATAVGGLGGAGLAGGLDSSLGDDLYHERNIAITIVGAAIAAGVAQAVGTDIDDRLDQRCPKLRLRHYSDVPPEALAE